MNDPILNAFMQRQQEDAIALAESSSLLNIVPLGGYTRNTLHCGILLQRTRQSRR